MAKKVTGYIKLQIPAGKATPAPPVGPAPIPPLRFRKPWRARKAIRYRRETASLLFPGDFTEQMKK